MELIWKQFYKRHCYKKIFNTNIIKLIYSCTSNAQHFIKQHNNSIKKSEPNTNKEDGNGRNLFEWFYVDLNFRSKKRLFECSYNHRKGNIAFHLSKVSAALDKLCTDYENIILLDDCNVEVKEKTFLTLSVHTTWKDL